MTKRLFAGALAVLFLAGCAETPSAAHEQQTRAPVAPRPGPALWVVKDADTTIYLFGTVHMLPDGFAWLNEPVEKAFDSADTLVLETLGAMEPGKVRPTIMELGFSPGQPRLAERLPAEKQAELGAALTEAGIPAAALDPMETWLATMTLSSARIVKLGYGLESGVESLLSRRAAASRKRVEGLETIREQLSFFDTLPEDEQRTLLAASLDDTKEIKSLIERAVADWAAGDVDAVAAALEEDINSSPVLAKRLLADRNVNWANWIGARLKSTPGTVFVAVGTGHLAGGESVQMKLLAIGLNAERMH